VEEKSTLPYREVKGSVDASDKKVRTLREAYRSWEEMGSLTARDACRRDVSSC
jgi:hypothetical protein